MKRKFTFLIAALALLACFISPTTLLADEASYVFNTQAGLEALGIAIPSQGSGTDLGTNTYTVGQITMSSTDGGTATRIWYSSGNNPSLSLRVYKGNSNNNNVNGTLTFTAASDYTISEIVITKTSGTFTANAGTLTGSTWTGSASSVTFTCTANATINTIAVTYSANAGPQLTQTTTSITVPQNFNDDLYVSTDAGQLSASVTYGSGTAVPNATVTWSSTNEGVATVTNNGTVTLVATGTTDIKATYAGDNTTFAGSYGTYQLTVVDNTPSSGTDVTFTAGTEHGTSTGQNADSMTKDGVTVSGTSAALNQNPYRIYGGSTTTISVAAGYTITKIVINGANGYNVSGFNSNAGSYSVDNNIGTWTGDASSVSFTNTLSSQIRVTSFVVTIEGNSTSTIAVTPTTLSTFSYLNSSQDPSAAQSVSVSGAFLTDDITVSVGASSDFEISTTENGTYNNNDITLQATNGTVTATSIWVRMKSNLTGSHSGTLTLSSNGASSVTIPLNGQVIVPMTVDEAIAAIDASTENNHNVPDAYVTGIISNVGSYSSNTITYYISSDGTTTSTQLEVYKGKGLNGANFTGADDLGVGDQVVVHGTLTYYNNTTYEFSAGSEIVSLTPHTAQQYDLTVNALSNVEMLVYDVNDLNNELIEGGPTAQTVQVSEGTSIQVLVNAAQGYALATFTVDGVDHLADIDPTDDSYTFTMPAHNVTISATAQQIYTISFYVNGTVDSNLEMTASSTLGTLPTPAAASVPTGFQFCGWMVKPTNDYYNASTAPTMVNASTAVSADMDLAAVFAQADNSNLAIGELTADEIADEFAAGGQAYADDEVEYVDGDFTWAAKYSANNTRHWIQLKNDADVYLKIEAPSSIQSVEVVISNTSNSSGGIDDITMHGAYDATGYIYLNTTNGGTHVGTTSGSDVVNNLATIVPSGDNTTLYLQVDKGARIWGVTVTCGQSTYCDYTTLVVNHADGSYIAENASETLYGIHYINGEVGALYDLTNNGKLIINNGGVLDLSIVEFTNNTAANLIIKDGAQLYTSNAVNGTIQKNITGYGDNDGGYYLVTAPATTVIGSTFYTTLNGDVDIYQFDQNEENFEWRNFKQATSAWNIGPACAMLYANKNDITLSFNGDWTNYDNGNPVDQHAQLPATNADINVPLEYTANKNFSGVNLIGNPFPCNATVNCSFYKMNDAGSALEPATDGEVIAPCTGIIVKTDGTVSNATFSKSTSTATVMRGTLNMNLTNQQNKVDKAIVSFNEGSELGKISLLESNATISFSMDGKDYAVVSSDATGELPLNFKASRNGEYTLSFDTENVEMGYLHLIDNLTGTDVDLLANPSYTFEGKKSDYASRFRLLFKATSINDIDTEMNDDFAFISDGNVIILNEGEATLRVIDIMGRIVSTQTVNGNASVNSVGAAGVYVLQLINGNNVKTQKIVVR